MKFTQISATAFQELQLNAGVLLSDFSTTGSMTEDEIRDYIIGATSGGDNFTAAPTYSDFGEDIDNAPINVKELKRLDSWEVKITGNFVALGAHTVQKLVGAADIKTGQSAGTLITPRNDVELTDFTDIWWVGDYGDTSSDAGGFIAIHMLNALSTGGFQVQSNNREKGQFAFEFTGHYSIDDPDTVPFEIYINADGAFID